ncbi:methyl-accepting chemotaxis protein [Desulfobacula toluolica]|uniref:Methyl-accepting chemotaxis sensory transducer n=1 Tax=Desulfobacula toluolica (strain DSM 7467 / Tol2) TaxID=651182 RepID=K0NKU0_DESTT|nr:methyl-accepting chemotaxis protein [Desulfobacula toluolica]CCK79352.1 methyl-accepting chemotaxis sensory transducer [Desulfobacula toluolica Tol2]
MFKKMKLGTKIFSGFALVLVFLCIVTFIGSKSLSGVVDRVEKADDVNRIVKTILETRQQEKNYIIRGGDTYISKVEADIKKLLEQAAEAKNKFTQNIDKANIDKVIEKATAYTRAFKEYVELDHQKDKAMEEMRSRAREVLAQSEAIRADQKQQLAVIMDNGADNDRINDKLEKADDANRIIKWFMDARKNEKEFIISKGENKWRKNVETDLAKILALSTDLKSRFKFNKNIEQINAVIAGIHAYDKAFDDFEQLMKTQEAADADMVAAARSVNVICTAARADQKAKMEHQISTANHIILMATFIAIFLGILFAFIITRAITKPLSIVIQGLGEGANQVASASGQVSSASQSLAEGSSQQAASIEETSSSMEEMSSMTNKNAENAKEAQNKMAQAREIVGKVNSNLEELFSAIKEIKTSSDETGKIVKTIDEIAFQTNLLALNAAVEAARAGEAGAGFAVVADEVRSLAMRAADAAKNTTELIDSTVAAVTKGDNLTIKTQEAFKINIEIAMAIGELIDEISGASSEQAIGIEQVNIAVAEMDKVVQQNAANAEESASASEELNAQAEQLKDYVGDLTSLVTGEIKQKHTHSPVCIKSIPVNLKTERDSRTRMLPKPKNEIRPDQVILFDENFKDF